MGNGRRTGNRLNFQITADYDMLPVDEGKWKRAFTKASEILFNATEGQLSFGRIFITKNSLGINNAEYILKDPALGGRGNTTSGAFGNVGRNINLVSYAQKSVLTILHELGHSLWRLDEEYARSSRPTIDKVTVLPAGHGNLIIPLLVTDLGIPDADFVGASVVLFFAGITETKNIIAKTPTQITVDTAFSQNPQNNDSGKALVQWPAECTGNTGTGACIMEFSRDNAGTLAPDGTWTPAANPVTEYCTAFNHDPDHNTAQHDAHGNSCWETIVTQVGFTDLVMPADGTAASKAAPAGFVAPEWVVLDGDPRFALVLDNSGSMNRNGGSRLQGVKTGSAYWIQNAALETDELCIVWYNSVTNTTLVLTDFSTLSPAQVQALVDDINAQTAGGATNIRDGLRAALTELTDPPENSGLQASLLLTDGAHNTPLGTSMLEVLPEYQDANTNIYTLGIGTGDEMDLAGLEALAVPTGGSAFTAGDGGEAFNIQNQMMEINNLLRGGLVSALEDFVPDKLEKDKISTMQLDPSLSFQKRISLTILAEKLKLRSLEALLKDKKIAGNRLKIFTLEIEQGAASATFTLSFSKKDALWMYLVDPHGTEVTPAYPQLAGFVDSPGQPYEFAKIKKPLAGKWKVIAFAPSQQAAGVKVKAFAGIQNTRLSVYASASRIKGKVNYALIEAGAWYGESLSGLKVSLRLKNDNGRLITKKLADADEDGKYQCLLKLPVGHYQGYVEIRSPGNTLAANIGQIILEARDSKEPVDLMVKHPPFVRTVPVSFYIGEQGKIRTDKSELKTLAGNNK